MLVRVATNFFSTGLTDINVSVKLPSGISPSPAHISISHAIFDDISCPSYVVDRLMGRIIFSRLSFRRKQLHSFLGETSFFLAGAGRSWWSKTEPYFFLVEKSLWWLTSGLYRSAAAGTLRRPLLWLLSSLFHSTSPPQSSDRQHNCC